MKPSYKDVLISDGRFKIFLELPPELWTKIIYYLKNTRAIFALRMVSKYFKEIVDNICKSLGTKFVKVESITCTMEDRYWCGIVQESSNSPSDCHLYCHNIACTKKVCKVCRLVSGKKCFFDMRDHPIKSKLEKVTLVPPKITEKNKQDYPIISLSLEKEWDKKIKKRNTKKKKKEKKKFKKWRRLDKKIKENNNDYRPVCPKCRNKDIIHYHQDGLELGWCQKCKEEDCFHELPDDSFDWDEWWSKQDHDYIPPTIIYF